MGWVYTPESETAGGPPSGGAGGDLTGTYPNPGVGTVGGTAAATVGAHPTATNNPHSTDLGNLGTGTLAELNAAVTNATLDDSGDSRPPSGAASGDLTGSFPDPLVKARTRTAVVDAAGNGDYLTPMAAAAAGETSVFFRNGSYVQVGESVWAPGTKLTGEGKAGVRVSFGGSSANRWVFKPVEVTVTAGTITEVYYDAGGTATFTQDSATVSGTGTTWMSASPAVAQGWFAIARDAAYPVKADPSSDTALTLGLNGGSDIPYRGVGEALTFNDVVIAPMAEGYSISTMTLEDVSSVSGATALGSITFMQAIGFRMNDVEINDAASGSAGAMILVRSCHGWHITDCSSRNGVIPILVRGGWNGCAQNIRLSGATSGGLVFGAAQSGWPHRGHQVDFVYVNGCQDAGIEVIEGEGLHITQVNAVNSNNAIDVTDPDSDVLVEHCTAKNMSGVAFRAEGSGTWAGCTVDGTTASAHGFFVLEDNVTLIDCQALNCAGSGMRVSDAATNLHVQGMLFRGNTSHGILLDTLSTDSARRIKGCTFSNNGGDGAISLVSGDMVDITKVQIEEDNFGLAYNLVIFASITGDTDDFNPPGLADAKTLVITPDDDLDLTGLVCPFPDQRWRIEIRNGATISDDLIMKHNDGDSLAANRFYLPDNSDVVVKERGSIWLEYDPSIPGFTARSLEDNS